MKSIEFEHVAPKEIRVGDIIMCFKHNDQSERRAARVVGIEWVEDGKPGRYTWASGFVADYDYALWLLCRHVNIKRLDAEGGPVYCWHRFNWNGVSRYVFQEQEQERAGKQA